MKRILGVLLAFVLAACRSAQSLPAPARSSSPAGSDRPIVILVSIDGWRYDYFDRFKPVNLSRLAENGVRATGLIPQFPSKTFPNHYTIVTGLRLAHHGIVSNNMVAPDLPGKFTMSAREVTKDPRWWGGEPMWNTVERQGGIAAAMFWPGSETVIGGHQATFWKPFDDTMPDHERVAQVLDWLRLPEEKRPSFLTLYFSDVDHAGHDVGPESTTSKELPEAIAKVDTALGELVKGVAAIGLNGRVNYVVVSDHGMSQLSKQRLIMLDDFIDPSTTQILDSGPVLAISPKDGDTEKLYAALKGRSPHMAVYRNAEIPAIYGLAGHPRVPAIMAIADDGWYITSKLEVERWKPSGMLGEGGAHGYDPRLKSMHGLFIASGPKVRNDGAVVKPFENIQVYDFLCVLLGLRPAANDGDPSLTKGFLR